MVSPHGESDPFYASRFSVGHFQFTLIESEFHARSFNPCPTGSDGSSPFACASLVWVTCPRFSHASDGLGFRVELTDAILIHASRTGMFVLQKPLRISIFNPRSRMGAQTIAPRRLLPDVRSH